MNVLTFDIEEWAISKASGTGNEALYARFDSLLDMLLDKLDEKGVKATFFCLGKIATDFPNVVRRIDAHGHEIGCHSHAHLWVNKMTENDFREDIHIALASIEDLVGKKVVSFRAPAFSIGESNLWAFSILAENGVERDASVFPSERDYGGFPGFGSEEPCIIETNGVKIKEFPIAMATVLNRRVAFSGGGYFRVFPLNFIKKQIASKSYTMCYFHISDLLPEITSMMSKQEYEDYFKETSTILSRYKRKIKSNIGKKNAFNKLANLIDSFSFLNMQEAEETINWTSVPHIVL